MKESQQTTIARYIFSQLQANDRCGRSISGVDGYNDLGNLLKKLRETNSCLDVVVWIYSRELSALISEASSVSSFTLDIDEEEDFPWEVFQKGEEVRVENIEQHRFGKVAKMSPNTLVYSNNGWCCADLFPVYVHGTCRGVVGFFFANRHAISPEVEGFQMLLRREIARFVSESDLLRERVDINERLKNLTPLLALGRESSQRLHDIRDNLDALRGLLIAIRDEGEQSCRRVQQLCVRGLNLADRIKEILSKQMQTFRRARERKRKIDLCAWIRQQDDKYRMLANGYGVWYQPNIPQSPIYCGIQTFYLDRAIENLLSNAVYFARQRLDLSEPFVRLDVFLRENEVVISILDSGPGVQQIPIEKIFEEGETTKPGGFGVGLGIVKSIVEDHEGCIDVENAQGSGALFTIRLPTKK